MIESNKKSSYDRNATQSSADKDIEAESHQKNIHSVEEDLKINKGFSFVSVVMEPNKNNGKSMKTRDKHKPLVDAEIIDKQISF